LATDFWFRDNYFLNRSVGRRVDAEGLQPRPSLGIMGVAVVGGSGVELVDGARWLFLGTVKAET
jgi:hypothetical protein